MNILGHGIDIVSIQRIGKILDKDGSTFVNRVFSAAEQEYCKKKKNPATHFAARFAAKEAYGKALGVGLGPSGNFADIEVCNEESGAPRLNLRGEAKEIFASKGGKGIFLSLSHDGDSAIASVIIVS